MRRGYGALLSMDHQNASQFQAGRRPDHGQETDLFLFAPAE